VSDNVHPFPGAKIVSPAPGVVPLAATKISGRRVRVINSMPTAKSKTQTAAGTGVEVGREVRASINRIGEYLDLIDAMRGEVDDVVLSSQLSVIEGALASMCFMHQPPPKRHA